MLLYEPRRLELCVIDGVNKKTLEYKSLCSHHIRADPSRHWVKNKTSRRRRRVVCLFACFTVEEKCDESTTSCSASDVYFFLLVPEPARCSQAVTHTGRKINPDGVLTQMWTAWRNLKDSDNNQASNIKSQGFTKGFISYHRTDFKSWQRLWSNSCFSCDLQLFPTDTEYPSI